MVGYVYQESTLCVDDYLLSSLICSIVKDKNTDTKYIIEKEGKSDNRFTTLQSTKRLLMQVRLGEVCTHPNVRLFKCIP
jgi:hypothetical protein